jgi:hypothetical protein
MSEHSIINTVGDFFKINVKLARVAFSLVKRGHNLTV